MTEKRQTSQGYIIRITAFYNISQRNFGILLILWCSFKLWWNVCLDFSRSKFCSLGNSRVHCDHKRTNAFATNCFFKKFWWCIYRQYGLINASSYILNKRYSINQIWHLKSPRCWDTVNHMRINFKRINNFFHCWLSKLSSNESKVCKIVLIKAVRRTKNAFCVGVTG
jgi:hypothetical protein